MQIAVMFVALDADKLSFFWNSHSKPFPQQENLRFVWVFITNRYRKYYSNKTTLCLECVYRLYDFSSIVRLISTEVWERHTVQILLAQPIDCVLKRIPTVCVHKKAVCAIQMTKDVSNLTKMSFLPNDGKFRENRSWFFCNCIQC